MNTFVLFLLCAETSERLIELKIGTNVYRNATVAKRNEAEALVSFDGGIRKVKLSELPEPLRSKWFNEASEKEFFKKQESEKSAREAAASEARKRGISQEKYYDDLISSNETELRRLEKRSSDLFELQRSRGSISSPEIQALTSITQQKLAVIHELRRRRLALDLAAGRPSSVRVMQGRYGTE